MKTRTVWKVLLRHNKKLFSFGGGSERKGDDKSLRYSTRRVNKPRENQNPFLFCFDTLGNARELASNTPIYVIYEAEATGMMSVGVCRNGHVIEEGQYAYGTLFAKSLRLVKRIKLDI